MAYVQLPSYSILRMHDPIGYGADLMAITAQFMNSGALCTCVHSLRCDDEECSGPIFTLSHIARCRNQHQHVVPIGSPTASAWPLVRMHVGLLLNYVSTPLACCSTLYLLQLGFSCSGWTG